MEGIIVLDKPAGISSARAVSRVKRLLPRGTKIGHAGTLDPFATGVLLLLVGRATRLCEKLMDQPKQYDATIRLGATTATDDPESPPIHWPDTETSTSPSTDQITTHLAHFQGQIKQVPPVFSALKVKGRRSYDLARKGIAVDHPPRTVVVYGLQVVEYAWPDLRLRIDCGRGTYIRAIARDLGAALNVGGYLTQLRRTRIGQFDIETANKLETFLTENVESRLVPINALVH